MPKGIPQGAYPKWLDPEYSGIPVPSNLTPAQAKFAQEYVASGGHATNAAKAAGYSSKSAAVIGCNNLKNVVIADYIKEMRGAASSRAVAGLVEMKEVLSRMMRNPDGKVSNKDIRGAVMDLAKLEGFLIERVEHNNEVRIIQAATPGNVIEHQDIDWDSVEYDELGRPIGVAFLNGESESEEGDD